MRTLDDTITRLAALRARRPVATPAAANDALRALTGFGSNPGALRAFYFLPSRLAANAPLVVVLHGCTQTAAGYDHGAGWSQLAERHGFALLFPEQTRANNPNLCFNWYNPDDARRDAGEALSIRQMVATMVATHRLDRSRVYVTGLSAGGAMTSVMLATYPDVFAGGAIIAGLAHGTASNVPEAFDRMRGHGGPAAAALGPIVAAASDHPGPWPIVSVWHGERDATVSAANAGLIVEQWRRLHGAPAAPSVTERVDGHARREWRDAAGRAAIEDYRIAGMGHGTPLATTGADGCGVAGPYMLDVGISSSHHIARFWGLLAADSARAAPPAATAPAEPRPRRAAPSSLPRPTAANGPGKVIEDALRAAGLMR